MDALPPPPPPQQQQQLPSAGTLAESEGVAAEREARILTWNINGLRKVAADHGGVKQLLDQFNADIVCLQEIKITRAGLVEHDLARAEGYHGFFNHCKLPRKVSYSGVATFVRSASESGLKTLASTTSLGDSAFFSSPPGGFVVDNNGGGDGGGEGSGLLLSPDRIAALDSEGRVLVTDHGHFVLFNVYAPCISSGDEDDKTEERREFKRDFLAALEARLLETRDRGRRVVLVGDLNACASQLDHGFTITDAHFYASNWSKWIRGMLGLGSPDPPRLVDCFRLQHPDRKNAFTCWNTQTGARENNYGTRIDYIIADAAFADRGLRACDILPDFLGSDHCPVRASFAVPFFSSPGLQKTDTSHDRGQTGGGGGGGGGEVCYDDDNASTIEGEGEGEWPEHPPECSCFYRELRAKQEKLAKYFMAGGQQQQQQQQAPHVDTQQRRGDGRGVVAEEEEEEETGAGRSRRGSSVTLTGGGGGAGRSVRPLVRPLPGWAVTSKTSSNDAAAWVKLEEVERGPRASGTTSSSRSGSRGVLAKRPTAGGSRQSKLTFGAAASVSVDGGGRGYYGGGGGGVQGAPASAISAEASARRAGAGATGAKLAVEEGFAARLSSSSTDDERRKGSSSSTAASAAASAAAAVVNAPERPRQQAGWPDNDNVRGGGTILRSDGGTERVNRTTTTTTTSSSGGDARGVGAGSGVKSNNNAGSAEAWKALFGQKKSSPPCEHGEPSIQRTVLKPGPNCNRRFYTCARSAGNWPTDRNARCNFFQWRRDGVRGYKDRPPGATNKKRRM